MFPFQINLIETPNQMEWKNWEENDRKEFVEKIDNGIGGNWEATQGVFLIFANKWVKEFVGTYQLGNAFQRKMDVK